MLEQAASKLGLNALDTGMKDFIYSVYITKENPSSSAFELRFGVDGDSFWKLKVDFDAQNIVIGNHEIASIKTASYLFSSNREYRFNVVINDGVMKLYIDDQETASLVYQLQGYQAGAVEDNLETSLLSFAQRRVTSLQSHTGDIFCGGYEVYKVINLTDDNYRLDATKDYVINEGDVSISREYLNTLENDTEYKFRAVTSLTDLDFYVHTKEIGAQLFPLVEKNYRGNDISFELSEEATVYRVQIDATAFDFKQHETIVTISKEELEILKSGEHTIKCFTSNGRPQAKFSLYPVTETIPELPSPISHVFFYIDIAIFAALVIGYVSFTLIRKKNGRKEQQ